jgi:hypothetical protein
MDKPLELDPPSSCPRTLELRRHTALARALLDELDRILPSPGVGSRKDGLDEQLIEELRRLAHRILECTATVIGAPGAPAAFAFDSPQHRPPPA